MLWLVLGAALSTQPAPELRLHHLHVTVPDPAAAMADAAVRLGAERTILQGHGPGIRRDGRYLVFDRDTSVGATGIPVGQVRRDPADVYATAVRWIKERGVALSPAEVDASLAQVIPVSSGVTVVAFSTSATDAAIEQLRAHGTRPFETRADVWRFRATVDLIVEIMAETDRPDTHWCPMHPGIRSAGPSTCALCNMDLVPIPPPRVGEYALDVALDRLPDKRGRFRLRLVVRDPRTGGVVNRFLDVHERPFHLFIVSRDLSRFAHVHPEQRERGELVVEQALEPGEYMLIADFLPGGGTPQMVHRAVVTPGYSGALFAAPPPLRPGPPDMRVDGVRVKLEAATLTALRPGALRFVVSDGATGEPIRDLEPYLGAAAHLLLVTPDLTGAVHAHPEGAASAGPELQFDPVLPNAGFYKLWLQFQRRGKVFTVPFVIEVAPL